MKIKMQPQYCKTIKVSYSFCKTISKGMRKFLLFKTSKLFYALNSLITFNTFKIFNKYDFRSFYTLKYT